MSKMAKPLVYGDIQLDVEMPFPFLIVLKFPPVFNSTEKCCHASVLWLAGILPLTPSFSGLLLIGGDFARLLLCFACVPAGSLPPG
jgi:hypothetical protein